MLQNEEVPKWEAMLIDDFVRRHAMNQVIDNVTFLVYGLPKLNKAESDIHLTPIVLNALGKY